MSDTTSHSCSLPPELWLEIFEWATPRNIYQSDYSPFQYIHLEPWISASNVTGTLSLVCQDWRHLASHLLYKYIKISYPEQQGLRLALERGLPEAKGRNGDLVRRVVLPYSSTVTGPSRQLTSIEILKLCPNVEILIRPHPTVLYDGLRFDFDAEGIAFPNLRRLEWWHHNEADRSGGINSLSAVLRSVPNLRYLLIGGVVGLSHICMDPSEPVILPKLETLRLYAINGLLLRQIVHRWSLPSLIHVVFDSPLVQQGLNSVWDAHGDQLRTVEFGRHVRFLMTDNISPCLQGCPSLIELNYHIFFTAPAETNEPHQTLTRVGLHASVNAMLDEGSMLWSLLNRHFASLSGRKFPSLKRLILYGNWRPILGHPGFHPLWKSLLGAGRTLEISDNSQDAYFLKILNPCSNQSEDD